MLVNLPYTLAGYLPWTLPTGPPACISVSRESPEQRPGRGTAQHPLGWKSPARTELSQPAYPTPPSQPTYPMPSPARSSGPRSLPSTGPAPPASLPWHPYHHTPGYLPQTVLRPPHQPAYPIPSYTRPAGGPTSDWSETPIPSGLPYTCPSQKAPNAARITAAGPQPPASLPHTSALATSPSRLPSRLGLLRPSSPAPASLPYTPPPASWGGRADTREQRRRPPVPNRPTLYRTPAKEKKNC